MSVLKVHSGGFGRLFLLLLSAILSTSCDPRPKPSWNVVVVTFDTTRADHIGSYGHRGARTPTLDALAAEGVLFEQAVTPIPITLPSHSSLMTGKVPFAHGVRDNGIFVLGEAQTTLAELLKAAGYRTAAAIGSYPLTAEFGIDQGFELFDDHLTQSYENQYGDRILPKDRFFFDERRAAQVNEAVLPWLDEVKQDPFFLWVHYFDPHHPHEPPTPYDQLFAHDLYDGEIAYADESLGVLIKHLQHAGVYDRTLVVFTSDHGEGRGEHEESTHSLLIYDSTLHVPLIMKLPGGRTNTRIARRVSTVDVMPTLLDWLGMAIPSDLQGQSLVSLIAPSGSAAAQAPQEGAGNGGQTARRELYAETLSARFSRNWGELRGLYYGDYKYIHGPRPELYDLRQDPNELNDLVATEPKLAQDLKKRLMRFLRKHEVADLDTSMALDDEAIRRLEALGYLQAGGDRVGPIKEVLRQDGDAPQDHAHTISAYSHAKSLLFQNDPLQAQDFLLDLLRGDPENGHYLELLVQAKLKLGQFDEALQLLTQLEGSTHGYPALEDLQRLAGRIYLASGRLEGAYAKFHEAEAQNPTADGQFQLAQIYQARAETEQQLRSLQEALRLNPELTPARIDLAVAYAIAGDSNGAEAEFLTAFRLNPFSARAHYNYGAFLVQENLAEKALTHFQRAIELNPNYLQAHYALIEMFAGMGRREDAEKQFDILAELSPTSEEALWALDIVENMQ